MFLYIGKRMAKTFTNKIWDSAPITPFYTREYKGPFAHRGGKELETIKDFGKGKAVVAFCVSNEKEHYYISLTKTDIEQINTLYTRFQSEF